MKKRWFAFGRKEGLPPGAVVHVGEDRAGPARISVFDYDETDVAESAPQTAAECAPFRETGRVSWINVDGVHDVDLLESLGEVFDLHPLVLEDIANTTGRPKVEEYDDYLFLVLRMLRVGEDGREVQSEQVSLVLGRGFVLSFQERPGDVFGPLRERIRAGQGRVRKMGADYLAYALTDAIVDGYFAVVERLGDRVEALETKVLEAADVATGHALQRLRTEALLLRKPVWPLRETLSALQRSESPLLSPALGPYLADVHDHAFQALDAVETLREMIASLRDTHLSAISNRMNEIMKVLTLVATIFIPLTFIAGIYGMNFRYMPELEWRGGYFATLGVMAAVAAGMLYYFRRKKWL